MKEIDLLKDIYIAVESAHMEMPFNIANAIMNYESWMRLRDLRKQRKKEFSERQLDAFPDQQGGT